MKNFMNFKILIAVLIDLFLAGLSINISNYIRLNFLEDIKLETLCASLLLPVIFIL